MLTVQPFAALQNPRTLIRWHTRPVVLDAQFNPTQGLAHADAHFTQAQAISVFQQVAHHFQQGALLDRHVALLRQIEGHPHALVAVDLVQRVAEALQHRPKTHLMAHQTAFAQAGTLQLIADLLAHTLDLGLQHPGLIAIRRALRHVFADALQHGQRGFQAVGQVVEGIAIAAALFALAVQQAVERAGQAQQFTRVLFAEAFAGAAFDFVELLTESAQRLQAPGQADPQQRQQHQQSGAETQIEIFPQAFEGVFVLAHRLQRDDAERRAFAAEQFDFDVIDEEFLAVGFADPRELVTTPVVTRFVVDVLFLSALRAPDQVTFTVIDVAEQTAVGEVETLVRQLRRHLQVVALDPGGGNQRGDVRRQALLDGILQRQAERALHRRQQRQHEQHRQDRGGEHQTDTKRTNQVQRSLNR